MEKDYTKTGGFHEPTLPITGYIFIKFHDIKESVPQKHFRREKICRTEQVSFYYTVSIIASYMIIRSVLLLSPVAVH